MNEAKATQLAGEEDEVSFVLIPSLNPGTKNNKHEAVKTFKGCFRW